MKIDLFRHHNDLSSNLSIDELIALEQQELEKLALPEPLKPSQAITRAQGQQLLNSISVHPVVGRGERYKYDYEGKNIGFCFGRATYVNLMLLRMGVSKDSIKKIWTVGLTGGEVNWRYHVATAVRTTDGKWTVIDNYVNRLVTVEEWAARMRKMSVDGKKTFFVTDASKFGPNVGKYNPRLLNLNVSKDRDFYRNYFTDLMTWFSSFESYKFAKKFGLTKVTGERISYPARLEPFNQSFAKKVSRAKTAAAAAICKALRFEDIFARTN